MIKLKGYLWLILFCWPLLLTAENLATSEPAALSVGKLLMKSKSKTLVQGIRYGIVERLFPPKAS